MVTDIFFGKKTEDAISLNPPPKRGLFSTLFLFCIICFYPYWGILGIQALFVLLEFNILLFCFFAGIKTPLFQTFPTLDFPGGNIAWADLLLIVAVYIIARRYFFADTKSARDFENRINYASSFFCGIKLAIMCAFALLLVFGLYYDLKPNWSKDLAPLLFSQCLIPSIQAFRWELVLQAVGDGVYLFALHRGLRGYFSRLLTYIAIIANIVFVAISFPSSYSLMVEEIIISSLFLIPLERRQDLVGVALGYGFYYCITRPFALCVLEGLAMP